MSVNNNGLDNLSKNELIDAALLHAVTGGECQTWQETCGCEKIPGQGECCDWCGRWVPKITIVNSPEEL